MICKFWACLALLGLATASKKAPEIVGEGLSRSPANGFAELDQKLECFMNGQEPAQIEWSVVSEDGTEVPLTTDDVSLKADDPDVTYRCKVDEDHYADFIVGSEDEPSHLLLFRVDKFEKSYSVVEQEDLKIECKISNRTGDIDVPNDVLIKWYMYNSTGDDKGYVSAIGNCSEELQLGLHWHEVIVDKNEAEPHINLIEANNMLHKVLKIEDANPTTDRRAFKCVAYHREARGNCSESAFFVRVRDKYAALWPFLGIVSEVIVVCLLIFICEHRRLANAKEEIDDDDDEVNGGQGTSGTSGNSNVRHRK